ncbi:hypothetical protein AB0K48_10050 [Nonomuraea sp. NPDC055795]
MLERAAHQGQRGLDDGALQVEAALDLGSGELQRGDPAGQRVRAVQEEFGDDVRADLACGCCRCG